MVIGGDGKVIRSFAKLSDLMRHGVWIGDIRLEGQVIGVGAHINFIAGDFTNRQEGTVDAGAWGRPTQQDAGWFYRDIKCVQAAGVLTIGYGHHNT